ncbi:hypothetical protein NDU88_001754 [Pleurodeles waltl]|uniref:Uncharacterized protein n=1 Tax=Pleurodeles waltl TaxID=8319 RepID=A0AAV7T0U2_PLEWA|nr:hypothetical protein NDU88_001754 [Pleurodeles waltl]
MPMPAGLAGVLPLAHGDRSASAAAVAQDRGLPAVLTHGRSERNRARGQGPQRSADLDRCTGGESGLIVVIQSGTEVSSGAAALCGAPATGPNLGPVLPLDTGGATEVPQ